MLRDWRHTRTQTYNKSHQNQKMTSFSFIANNMGYPRLKNTKTLQWNVGKTISYCLLVNWIMSCCMHAVQQNSLILPLMCSSHKQLPSEFIPNPDFIKETVMVGFTGTKYWDPHLSGRHTLWWCRPGSATGSANSSSPLACWCSHRQESAQSSHVNRGEIYTGAKM